MKHRLYSAALATLLLALLAACTPSGGHASNTNPVPPSGLSLGTAVTEAQALPGDQDQPDLACQKSGADLGDPLGIATPDGTRYGTLQLKRGTAPGCQAVWIVAQADAGQSLDGFDLRLQRYVSCDDSSSVTARFVANGTQPGDILLMPQLSYDDKQFLFKGQVLGKSGAIVETPCYSAM